MTAALSRLELLVLARLSVAKPPSRRDLVRDLRPLAAPASTDTEFGGLLDGRLAELHARQAIERRPLRLTDTGASQLAEALGVEKAPRWPVIRDRLLPAIALGRSAEKARSGAELQAAILAELLGRGGPATLNGLLDREVATTLGLQGAVTWKRVRAHVLARRLGLDERSAHDDPAEVAARAAAAAVKAPRADARSLRAALARRWLAGDAGDAARPAVSPPSSPPSTPPPGIELDFADAVRRATAKVPSTGRFGADKVFVSAIWRQLGEGAALAGMTFDQFKVQLVAANQRGALALARADLVGAMDPREVAASEIRDLSSTFHFVLDGSHR